MTDEGSRQETGGESHDVLEALAEMQRAGLGSLNWMGVAWLEAMGDVGAEVASFIAERIREDARTQHEILHSRDAAELQRIQGHFVQTAIDQYAAETGRLVELEERIWESALAHAAGPSGDKE